ncbi:PREDICTED: 39S ribosomal protein L12, mitochondrial-like [Priapulus caudatus]|uniref:39S ribosomal protein L12, mitochondrial-like n=1 Tax=Priapulus caudatus TaxID=37621 RepID=A0ABM1EK35_PRICU|nr:PREDICTED: 39S ribosomal protein L12, mitochondrial-like [Priapulus caudatus]
MQTTVRTLTATCRLSLVLYRVPSITCSVLTVPCQSQRHQNRSYSSALPSPAIEGEEREYAPHINKIVQDISKLTLLEVADLNECLKKTLNIKDAAVMAMGAVAAAPAKEEEDDMPEKTKEKTSFTVKLTKFDDAKKVALIKQLKTVMEGMNLVQAKKFVESAPQVVRADIGKDEAEKLAEQLKAVGGSIEIE